ncbi:hypothetical protein POF50_011640 [Streptomyces sp. SL13]|uniref:DUF6745 domain-containing protein n=1 Tax=Streptantibioticus silvisoli TaxID=2705255 RepID=A0AA90H8P2_9ACTN|nr:hypothetical protein [Streptantibioticus silvisoli]MDI5969982.1 hypothetical protein [Streptantibioticus silvisoli]
MSEDARVNGTVDAGIRDSGPEPAGGPAPDSGPEPDNRPERDSGRSEDAPRAAAGAGAADWRAVAWRTGAADRAAAEAGMREAYRTAGLAEPGAVVWFDSPLTATAAVLLLSGAADPVRAAGAPGAEAVLAEAAAVLAAHGVSGAGPSVREAVRTAPWEAARRAAQEELGPLGWAGHWGLTGRELWEPVQRLTLRIRDAVTDRLAGPDEPGAPSGAARTAVRLALLDALLGQHDAPWLAALADRSAALAGQAGVAGAAGWWWPRGDCVLACERPVALHRDEAGRPHRADGPCVEFPDGFALHAWRGMPVPAGFSERLAALTAGDVRDEPNAELRRVMLEHYGYDRYLAETGARPLHRDETGVLWRVEMERDEPVVMVEVVNSTPEPDGTHRVYWLRVPPHTRTAKAGVAWTFGVTEEDYAPQRQT